MHKIARDIKLTLKITAVNSEMRHCCIRRPWERVGRESSFYVQTKFLKSSTTIFRSQKQVHFRLTRKLFQVKAVTEADHTNVCWFQNIYCNSPASAPVYIRSVSNQQQLLTCLGNRKQASAQVPYCI